MATNQGYAPIKGDVEMKSMPPPDYSPPPPPPQHGEPPPSYQEKDLFPPAKSVHAAVSVQPYYGSTPPQQPIMLVGAPPTPPMSFTKHLILSCVTFWCCGWIFGGIAFALAMMAQDKAQKDPEGARKYGKLSMILSIAGIATGIIIAITVIAIIFSIPSILCPYYMNGWCYHHVGHTDSASDCTAMHPSSSTYWDGYYCYYNH